MIIMPEQYREGIKQKTLKELYEERKSLISSLEAFEKRGPSKYIPKRCPSDDSIYFVQLDYLKVLSDLIKVKTMNDMNDKRFTEDKTDEGFTKAIKVVKALSQVIEENEKLFVNFPGWQPKVIDLAWDYEVNPELREKRNVIKKIKSNSTIRRILKHYDEEFDLELLSYKEQFRVWLKKFPHMNKIIPDIILKMDWGRFEQRKRIRNIERYFNK